MDPFDLRDWPGFLAAGGDTAHPAIIDQVAIDSRRIDSRQALFVPLTGEHFDGHQFISHAAQMGAHYAFAKGGWEPATPLPTNLTLLRVKDPLQALQAVARAYRQKLKCQVVGITGSYGKTMVKDLLQAMVAKEKRVGASPESFNSQIGVALSLFEITKDHEIALIELGISEKGEMDRLIDMVVPDYAVFTHVGKKHIATLGSVKAIATELMKLPASIPEHSWALLPHTQLPRANLTKLKAKSFYWDEVNFLLPFATALGSELDSRLPYRIDFPDSTNFSSYATFGFSYFLDLINITTKAAWLLGISSEGIRKALSHHTAEPMRTEIWQSPTGTTFVNDTYCSDPQSVSRALRHLEQGQANGRRVFVFGGMRDKREHIEVDYRQIGQVVRNTHVDHLLLVGDHPFASLMAEVQAISPGTRISVCRNHQEAIDTMRSWVRQDDIVLIKGEKKEPLDNLMEAFNDSICTNQCQINLAAIEANISTIRHKLTPKTRVMAMVKALAYGTNDIRMARSLTACGIDILGVSYVDEGVALKRAGVTQAIFVINAAVYEAAKVVKWGLEVGVSEKGLISALANEAKHQNKAIKVHLHVDTGMSRFGCRPEEALELAQYIRTFPLLELEGILTHFACADDPTQDEFTKGQADHFDQVIRRFEGANISVPWRHASNSSGVMRFNFPQFNMVRLGLAIYGLYPSEAAREALDLRLALSLVSRIVGINICRAGETISYGRSYTVKRDYQRIAVLPIGYFDGLHRNYSGKGYVMIRGKKAPMVGKICMDFMMVDVTDIPNASIGDSVLIFGEDEHGQYLSPEELASSGDSIVYELITCLGPRIQRIFIHEEACQKR